MSPNVTHDGGPRRIAVTPRSISDGGHPALRQLEKAGYDVVYPAPGAVPNEQQLRSALRGCVGYIAGTERLSGSFLSEFPELKAISRNGVGIDSIDVDAAKRQGISVLTAPGANSQGVAELTIALMMSAVRGIPWHDGQLKSGQWARRPGREVSGLTLGLLGCGQIGRRVALMALGLGMKVLAFDAYPLESFRPSEEFAWGSLDDVLRTSDVVSLHMPPSAEPVIGKATIGLLKRGAGIINTARASLVDDDSVLAALESGAVAFLATDVFETEPPGRTPLVGHPNVIATPHIGGYTGESVDRATWAAVDNLLQALANQH
ncbi:phosphoglycerate dehydrogenase [Paenarthrobacter sp. NyZ202]|uniref:phosphoglycerate dehydrogenase n=1 Tax=Paenarthrobacter sp. NyZ202 TaxID=3402689 RepID=UPI003CF732AC